MEDTIHQVLNVIWKEIMQFIKTTETKSIKNIRSLLSVL